MMYRYAVSGFRIPSYLLGRRLNMTTTTIRPGIRELSTSVRSPVKTKITLFHCFNALNSATFLNLKDCDIRCINLPCSSMTREIVLLKAFEDNADAVIVLVCPEKTCHYLQGNLRAKKRVMRVKKLLDEIGLDGRRLNIYNIPHGDQAAVEAVIRHTILDLNSLGPVQAS
jgi:F420-non-reducing hydrogenase iron-sulfur subunit